MKINQPFSENQATILKKKCNYSLKTRQPFLKKKCNYSLKTRQPFYENQATIL
jgi:hypothetical protein